MITVKHVCDIFKYSILSIEVMGITLCRTVTTGEDYHARYEDAERELKAEARKLRKSLV